MGVERLQLLYEYTYNRRIQKYILEVPNKPRKPASVIKMYEKNKKVHITCRQNQKNNAKKTDEIIDQCVAFVTNMIITNKSKLLKTTLETCCKR